MSNTLAIAAVTATLRNLLIPGLTADLPDTDVTTRPPDQARNGDNGNQVNLFLYQTEFNSAWRNMPIPQHVRSGESGPPPLALNLFYLLTAYGQNDDDTFGHRLLGRAMRILHDHPILSAAEIEAALPDNDLHAQVERVRITPQPLSLDEMSKLWTTFQAQYRISTAYQVAVVLIESTRATRTPLPVLTRGADDEGPTAQGNLIPPFPTLAAVRPPRQQPGVRVGESLTLSGHHLAGDDVVIFCEHPRLDEPLEVAPLPGRTDTEIEVTIPDEPGTWLAGIYRLAVGFRDAGELVRRTNELPFALAPRLIDITPDPAPRDAAGTVTLTVRCSPQVSERQRVALLLGDREIMAEPFGVDPADSTEKTDTLEFIVADAPGGRQFVRLRVDGVDSLLVNRGVEPPVFDESQQVTIS